MSYPAYGNRRVPPVHTGPRPLSCLPSAPIPLSVKLTAVSPVPVSCRCLQAVRPAAPTLLRRWMAAPAASMPGQDMRFASHGKSTTFQVWGRKRLPHLPDIAGVGSYRDGAATCAPAPLLGRRRAVLHVALLAPSATLMHTATARPRATATARPCAAAAAAVGGARPSTTTIAATATAAQAAGPQAALYQAASPSARAACPSQRWHRGGPAVQRSTGRDLSLSDT